MGVRRGVRAAAVAVCAAVIVAGCGDETVRAGGGSTESTTVASNLPVAAEPSALHPPGSDLVDGVSVQEGSWLVGSAFPLWYEPDGWQAVFVVEEGDSVQVWDRYAEALGLADSADAVKSCVVRRVGDPLPPPDEPIDPGTPGRFLTEERLDGENRLRCEARLSGVWMQMGVGNSRSPDLCDRSGSDEPAVCEHTMESHLHISVDPSRSEDSYERFATDELRIYSALPSHELAPIPDGPVVPPQLEVTGFALLLPGEGERLDGGLDGHLGPDWVVPDGGRSLVAPAVLFECTTSVVAVLDVPGTPSDVVDTFDAASEDDDALMGEEGTDAAGRDWAGGAISTAGGYHLSVVALATGADSSTVMVTECGD